MVGNGWWWFIIPGGRCMAVYGYAVFKNVSRTGASVFVVGYQHSLCSNYWPVYAWKPADELAWLGCSLHGRKSTCDFRSALRAGDSLVVPWGSQRCLVRCQCEPPTWWPKESLCNPWSRRHSVDQWNCSGMWLAKIDPRCLVKWESNNYIQKTSVFS